MPRKRTKQVTEDTPIADETVVDAGNPVTPPEPVQPAPDIFDVEIQRRKEEKTAENFTTKSATPPEAAPAPNGFASRNHANGHIANPSSKRRESHAEAVQRRFPDKLTVVAGDLKVQLVDAGRNEMGVGIRVVANSDRKLTDEEKAIIRSHVKGENGEDTGFSWQPDSGLWHKHILREGEHVDDVPPSRPVAIRLSAERIVQNLGEALREHAVDPVGYAEMVKQRREQAAEAGRIPD